MSLIPIINRRGEEIAVAIVDECDAPWLSAFAWRMNGRYPTATVDGRQVRMHSLILPNNSGMSLECDHINRDRLDNRRANLRLIPHAGNMQNRGSFRGSLSRFRGVRPVGRRWRAEARMGGSHHHIGYFATEEEAAIAASEWRMQHMPFAVETTASA